MQKKLSSYQKNKQKYEAQIKSLTDDIVSLVTDPESPKSQKIKSIWILKLGNELLISHGLRVLDEYRNNRNRKTSETINYMKGETWEMKQKNR